MRTSSHLFHSPFVWYRHVSYFSHFQLNMILISFFLVFFLLTFFLFVFKFSSSIYFSCRLAISFESRLIDEIMNLLFERWEYLQNVVFFFSDASFFLPFILYFFFFGLMPNVCNQGLFAVFVATRNELLKAIRIGIIFSVDDFSALRILNPLYENTFHKPSFSFLLWMLCMFFSYNFTEANGIRFGQQGHNRKIKWYSTHSKQQHIK